MYECRQGPVINTYIAKPIRHVASTVHVYTHVNLWNKLIISSTKSLISIQH